MAKKEYEALNAQLVEELQVFNQAARKILLNCLCSFITLLQDLTLVRQQLYSTVVPVSTAPAPGHLGLGIYWRQCPCKTALSIACTSVVRARACACM